MKVLSKTVISVLASVFLFNVIWIDDRLSGATVSITRNFAPQAPGGSSLVFSSIGGFYGALGSPLESYTITSDTLADTAAFTDMQFVVSMTGGEVTRSRTFTTVTPPTDFPNSTVTTTTTFTETVSIDPITLTNLAPQFVSSTMGALKYNQHDIYKFFSTVAMAFPTEAFTLSGTYKLQGPTQTVTVPFSILSTRTTSAIDTRTAEGFIKVGNNFPDTADISSGYVAVARYIPANGTIFNGTVDGFNVRVEGGFATITAFLPIPEPATWLLALGAASLLALRRRC